MKESLKPHRDIYAEAQLKEIIGEIQALLHESKGDAVDELLKKAAQFIKSPDRVLDLEVIEHYEGWTDLDGLAGELTMEVPRLENISKEDFTEIVLWIRKAVENEQEMGDIRPDFLMDFYREFFALHFPDAGDGELLDEIFDGAPLEKLLGIAFPDS